MEVIVDLNDPFVIHENVEEGRFVFGGTHSCLGKVACKVIGFRTETTFDLGMQELHLSSRLIHPSICSVLQQEVNTTEQGSCLRLFMPLLPSDLGKQIEVRKFNRQNLRWSEESLWNILAQVVDALAYAQRNFICHRDIKPSNLLINEQGRVSVTDFGSAKNLSGVLPSQLQSTITGTISYFSPEMYLAFSEFGSNQTAGNIDYYKSDMFSLGVTFLQMMDLKAPMLLQNTKLLPRKINNLLDALKTIYSAELLTVVGAMLEVNSRYRLNFTELLMLLKVLKGDWGTEVPPRRENFILHPPGMFTYKRVIQREELPQSNSGFPPVAMCAECKEGNQKLLALTCGHSFCSQCVQRWCRLSVRGRSLQCSIDRRTLTVREDEIARNFFQM